jgi:hypothetical protein
MVFLPDSRYYNMQCACGPSTKSPLIIQVNTLIPTPDRLSKIQASHWVALATRTSTGRVDARVGTAHHWGMDIFS